VRHLTDNTTGTIIIDYTDMGKGTYVLRILTISGMETFLLPATK
jgi:hypothetical protein